MSQAWAGLSPVSGLSSAERARLKSSQAVELLEDICQTLEKNVGKDEELEHCSQYIPVTLQYLKDLRAVVEKEEVIVPATVPVACLL